MTVMGKPRTGAFVLDATMYEEFIADRNHSAKKSLERLKRRKPKADVVDSNNVAIQVR